MSIFFRLPPSESSWGLGGVCSVSGPLRGAGEAELRIALSRARAAVRPTVRAPRRVPRIWGHWAHLMTTVHRGRSSECGFVAQFLRLRKSVSRSVPALFFWACLHFYGPCVWEDQSITHKVVSVALSSSKHSKQKSTSVTRQPRSGTHLDPTLSNEARNLPAWSI